MQIDHPFLITGGIRRVWRKRPIEEAVGIIRREIRVQDPEPFAVVCDFRPVPLNILQVRAEVSVGALEDLLVDRCRHDRLDVNVLLISRGGIGEHVIGSFLDGSHELGDFLGVLGDESFVGDVQDGAEAAAAELGELVDAQHLHVGLGPVLRAQPFFELDHLHVLQADAGVDLAFDDGFGDIHATANGGVVVGSHAVVFGELVDLDLCEGQYLP